MGVQRAQGRPAAGGGKSKVPGPMKMTQVFPDMAAGRTSRRVGRDTDKGIDSEGAPQSSARGQSFGGTTGGTAVRLNKG